WWPKPVFTPGNINWLTEISSMTGARNLFDGTDSANIQTDWADVLERQPDYILLAWVHVLRSKVKPELVRKRPGWNELKAIDHIRGMYVRLDCRVPPGLIAGASRLGKLLHREDCHDAGVPRCRRVKHV